MLKKLVPLLACFLVTSLAGAAPLAVVEKDGLKGCLDTTGKTVIPLRYKTVEVAPKEDGLVAVQQDGKYGVYNRAGHKLAEPVFDKLSPLSEGIFGGQKDGQWAFYDRNGHKLCGGYEAAGSFQDNLAPVQKGGLWGYIDKTGKLIIPYQYKEAHDFSEQLAVVKKGKYWGYIKTDGSDLLLPNLRGATDFSQGLAVVDGNWLMDNKGKRLAKLRNYSYIGSFASNGLLEVGVRRRSASFLDYLSIGWGFGNWWGWGLDAGGFGVGGSFGGHHHHHHDHWGGFIAASPGLLMPSNFHRGYVNTRGVEIISPDNDYVGVFVNGYALVKNERRWGMVSKDGETLIPYAYDVLTPFYNGLAAFQFDKKWGYIDMNNNVAIKNRFSQATAFFTEYASAVENGQGGLIDKKGSFVFPPSAQFKAVGPYQAGLAAFKDGKKWGYFNFQGQVVIAPQYDSVSMFQ